MTSGRLINVVLLIMLNSVASVADAGSSATAITTISANIVPAASFTVSNSILLEQSATSRVQATNIYHSGQVTKPLSAHKVILKTDNTKTPARIMVSSSQNMAFNISMSSSVRISDDTKNITASINHIPQDEIKLDINKEHELRIDGIIPNTESNNSGSYHGLIDITLNYN